MMDRLGMLEGEITRLRREIFLLKQRLDATPAGSLDRTIGLDQPVVKEGMVGSLSQLFIHSAYALPDYYAEFPNVLCLRSSIPVLDVSTREIGLLQHTVLRNSADDPRAVPQWVD